MKIKRTALLPLALAFPIVASSSPCFADIAAKDVQIVGRVLSFVENPPSGTVELAIAYAPDNPASVKEAEALKGLLGDGTSAGKVTLKPKLVPMAELAALNGVAAIYVTQGASGDAPIEAGKRLHVPVMSTDAGCAQSAHCSVGFRSEPSVEIVVNKAAADASGVAFQPSFRMLIKEI